MIDWQEYSEVPTEELVEYIRWHDSDDTELLAEAEKAFYAFFFRFTEDLTKKCEIYCTKKGHDKGVAVLIAKRTFAKFKKKTLTYKHDETRAKDFDTGVRLYMYQTARNELINYYREQNGFGASRFTRDEQLVWKVDDLQVFKEKPEKTGKLKETYDLLQHTLSNFDWKKRLIYLTYLDADVKEGEMPPRHLSKLLREATGLSQQSVRKYNNEVRNIVTQIVDVYAKKR